MQPGGNIHPPCEQFDICAKSHPDLHVNELTDRADPNERLITPTESHLTDRNPGKSSEEAMRHDSTGWPCPDRPAGMPTDRDGPREGTSSVGPQKSLDLEGGEKPSSTPLVAEE